jgi:hypothetical protein
MKLHEAAKIHKAITYLLDKIEYISFSVKSFETILENQKEAIPEITLKDLEEKTSDLNNRYEAINKEALNLSNLLNNLEL